MSLGLTLTYKLGECGISCLALFSVMVLYMIVTSIGFIYYRNTYAIKSRSFALVSIQTLASFVIVFADTIYQMQPNSTSCPNIPFFISINISVCLLVYCIFVRGISLAARMKINEALLGRFKDHAAAAVLVPSSSALDMATGIPDALLPPPRGSASTKESGGSDKEKGKVFWSFLIRYREYLTEKCMLQLTAVFLVVLIIPVLAIFFTIGNASCRPNPAFGPDYTIIKIAFISFFIGGPVLLYFIRNVQDGHDIRQDLVISICINIPLYIAFVGWYTFDALIEFTDSGWWAPPNFVMMAVFVAHTLAVTKPLAKVIKEDLRSRSGQVDLEMNHDSFGRLIERKDAKLWISFKEYAVREFCVENVLFYEEIEDVQRSTANLIKKLNGKALSPAALNDAASSTSSSNSQDKHPPKWRKQLDYSESDPAPVVPQEARARWKKLYDEYIAEGASSQLNVPFHMSKRVAEAVRSETYALDMFDAVRQEVLRMLYENTFSKFVRSSSAKNG